MTPIVRTSSTPLPWQERAFLSIAEAAEVFGQSDVWIRFAIDAGELVTVRRRRNGPKLICVESVLDLLRRRPDVAASSFRPSRPRLVWTNPNL